MTDTENPEYAVGDTVTVAGIEFTKHAEPATVLDTAVPVVEPIEFTLTVKEGADGNTIVEMWHRERISVADFAARLHQIADGFADNSLERVQ